MGEVKHTPGPWKVGYRALDIMAPNPKGGEAKIFDVRGWGFLTGKGHGALGLSEDEAEAVQKANAQLAAAAPDLLGALRIARPVIAEMAARDGNPMGCVGRLLKLDAAIAKAESSHGA